MKRQAFTLIELLLVISIIGILLALTVAGVMRVRGRATEVETRSEMLQLGLAADTFKSKHNNVMPMCAGGGANGAFRLCSSYLGADGKPLQWPEVVYLSEVFPSMSFSDNGLRVNGQPVPPSAPVLLDGNRAMMLWVCGGKELGYAGFCRNPQQPFTPPVAGEDRERYYAPTASQTRDPGTGVDDGVIRDRWGTPLVIFSRSKGVGYAGANTFGVSPYLDANGKEFNPRGFQIISAGPNKSFGPGGLWTAGQGLWADSAAGGDDMTNFTDKKLSVSP